MNTSGYAQVGIAGPVTFTQVTASAATPNDCRTEQLLNMASVLCEQSNTLAQRIENLDQRMFGSPNVGGQIGEKASAPQPVRPAIDELQHRLGIVHNQVQRAFDAINRLERL